jgi:hypothetical protein
MSNSVYFGAPTSTNQPANSRFLQDANTNTSVAIPVASQTVYSAYIDLRQDVTYSTSELLNIFMSIPAQSATGASAAGVISYYLQAAPDSAAAGSPDAGPTTWTNVASLPEPVITSTDAGTGGGSQPGASGTFKLSPGVNRYLRIKIVTDANCGSTPSGSALLQVNY